MWRTQNGCIVARALVLATLWLAVAGRPLVRRSLALSNEQPLILYGWDKSTRLQHLYVSGPHISNCFLNIRSDGSVDCEDEQSERNLLEFRPVALKTISIKDVSSVRYLCMSADGKIQGLIRYSEEDCTFSENLSYIGYNQYRSPNHHLYVILLRNKHKQQQLSDKKPSNFLPMISRIFKAREERESKVLPLTLDSDSMDPFKSVKDMEIKSPSFQK
ncbi:fibroblast growth factor 19 [Phodopus roborovskii]|uniref:Fibroblast growth factor n=1 Tax=Phodopus roborovskii TaxID=109678 RepID=A0AAU9ZLD4_PHORO|nr:fibroblast growth factor 19 [Phodopus roborovskii]CAH6793427.1 Fgf15 [Phodopus roborovskii]